MRSYPVLDPVSQAYPKVQGRSPTCYSPVRHSSHSEEHFPFDLHVLSTPPAFVLSQDQTLQTKKTPRKKTRQNSNQNNLTKARHQTLGIKKTTPPTRGGYQSMAKKQQQTKKTTKHTIEFSNNTPPQSPTRPRSNPATRRPRRYRADKRNKPVTRFDSREVFALSGLAGPL